MTTFDLETTPLRALNAGTPLRALARTAAADWLQVEVQPARTPGWVAAHSATYLEL